MLKETPRTGRGPADRSVDCAKLNPVGPGTLWMTSELAQYSYFPSISQDSREVQMALSHRLDLFGGPVARRMKKIDYDHSAGYLAVFSIHFELPRR
jgi:hypothetical protein